MKLPLFPDCAVEIETVSPSIRVHPTKHCENCQCQTDDDYRRMGVAAATWFGNSVPYLFLEALWLELGRKYYIHRMK